MSTPTEVLRMGTTIAVIIWEQEYGTRTHITDTAITVTLLGVITKPVSTATERKLLPLQFVSDIAAFVLKRDVKLQLTHSLTHYHCKKLKIVANKFRHRQQRS